MSVKISVFKERYANETRVAITPDAVKRYVQLGAQMCVESGAGAMASVRDGDYTSAGAVVASHSECLDSASIVLKVHHPDAQEVTSFPQGMIVVGMLDPYRHREMTETYNAKNLSTFSLELLPRISRAQSMDVLSSQSNLAGYRAVIEAVAALGKAVPMMMTAAGTVAPAKVLVLGAGVAGLQAIATAKRLGAVVSAFDVRAAAKEQVESLGAKFIEVPAEESGDAAGGYAKEMSEDYQRRQRQLIHDTIIKQDIVISTALIPGKPAPVLITEEMVADMKEGSVVVDLAAASGGNCPLTVADQIVSQNGVTLIGYTNLPGRVPTDASALYARNLYNFVSALLLTKEGTLLPQWEDELVKGTLLTHDGNTVHPQFK